MFDGSAGDGFEAALLLSMDGHGCGPRVKNGPALVGYGAETVRDAAAREITTLPGQLRQSLTRLRSWPNKERSA